MLGRDLHGVQEDVALLAPGEEDRESPVTQTTSEAETGTAGKLYLGQDDFGRSFGGEPLGFELVGGPADHLDLGHPIKGGGQRLAEEGLRVDDEEPNVHAGIVTVPFSAFPQEGGVVADEAHEPHSR